MRVPAAAPHQRQQRRYGGKPAATRVRPAHSRVQPHVRVLPAVGLSSGASGTSPRRDSSGRRNGGRSSSARAVGGAGDGDVGCGSPEALYAQWAAAAAAVAVEAQQQQQQQQQGSLVAPRVVRPPRCGGGGGGGGGGWRIRHFNAATDLQAVAELQAAAFSERGPPSGAQQQQQQQRQRPPPLPLLGGLAGALQRVSFAAFRAEVLSALQSKARALDPERYAVLVAEEEVAGEDEDEEGDDDALWLAGDGGSSRGSGWSSGEEEENGADDASGFVSSSSSSSSSRTKRCRARARSAAAVGAAPAIVGVVEVGVQEERDVLRQLPRRYYQQQQQQQQQLQRQLQQGNGASSSSFTYAYLSSMAVAPGLRRRGLGAALLRAAEEQAALWRQPLLCLHVYETNAAAAALYARCGLARAAEDPGWRRALPGGRVRRLMVKKVAAADAEAAAAAAAGAGAGADTLSSSAAAASAGAAAAAPTSVAAAVARAAAAAAAGGGSSVA